MARALRRHQEQPDLARLAHDRIEAVLQAMREVGLQWNTEQLRAEFEVIGFMAPFVTVRRKADGVKGSLEFVHSPRIYFNFQPD